MAAVLSLLVMIFGGSFLLPGAAQAEDAVFLKQSIVVTKKDCRRIVSHRPGGDVAYQPGVDVRGRPVAPADLGGRPRLDLPESYSFDITVDIRRFLDGPEDDADTATRAALAADSATDAATLAGTAADSAEGAAAEAQDIADAAAAASDAADAALLAAKAAVDADPSNTALRRAADAAETDAEAAAATAAQAQAEAAQVTAAAEQARSSADAAAASQTVDGKAAESQNAADAAADAASLAAAISGDPQPGEDPAVTELRDAGIAAASAASSASASAGESAAANAALVAAFRDARRFGDVDMTVGTVAYDTLTGELTFNGEPLGDAEHHAILDACRRIYGF